MARIIIPSQTHFSIHCVCFTLCYIQYSWTSFSPHQTSSSLLSHHHHYQHHPYYYLVLPRHSTLHSIFMDLSLEKDIIFSQNTNVKCFANLQHFFYKQHYEWLFSSWRGISYLHSENKVMSKLQWFSHIFATKNVEAQSNVYERQTILIKMFAIVIILETIETIDPAIAVPSNNLEEGRSMFVIDCLLYEHLHLLKDIIIWCTVYHDLLWG